MDIQQVQPIDQRAVGRAGTKALLQTTHFLLTVFRITILTLLGLYLVSGSFVVKPDEEAFILRFGKLVGETRDEQLVKSGQWHWAWPKPIDNVIRVPVKQTRTLHTKHFWYADTPLGIDGEKKHSRSMLNQSIRPGVDGYLLTGDNNIIHTAWSISYMITDPINFYLGYVDPENAISNALENAIVKVTASIPIHEILYSNNEAFEQGVSSEVRYIFDNADLGIALKNVACVRKEPPRFVASGFAAVIEAEQKRSQNISEAQGYRERVIQETLGRCARATADAQGYRMRIVASVEADNAYFKQIFKEYRNAPETMLMTLHSNALNDILKKVEKKFIIHTNDGEQDQELRLLIGNEADFLKQ